MASTSNPRGGGAAARIQSVAATLSSDNQSLLADMRKVLTSMRETGVDLEKDGQSDQVTRLEDAVNELVETYEDCMLFSSLVQSVGNSYQPKEELTDFKKLFDNEFAKLKATSSSVTQKHPQVRQFKEAIWIEWAKSAFRAGVNVHHAGQPMPGEEEEDIVMTNTQFTLLNKTCPLSGKPITELVSPVRSVECKHIYEEKVIKAHIRKNKDGRALCPVTGCPKILQVSKVICDSLLRIEIEELRSMSKEPNATEILEDFTELDEEDSE